MRSRTAPARRGGADTAATANERVATATVAGTITDGLFAGAKVGGIDDLLIRNDGVGVLVDRRALAQDHETPRLGVARRGREADGRRRPPTRTAGEPECGRAARPHSGTLRGKALRPFSPR